MATVIPLFECRYSAKGCQCIRERGHRGAHRCGCGASYGCWETHPRPHHDLSTITFPESEAA